MAKFEESSLFQALTAETKSQETILSALGSATVDFNLRSSDGQTYIHLAAANLQGTDIPEAWAILLSKCNMFIRCSKGVSGLDCMVDRLPVPCFHKYVKAYMCTFGSDADKIEEFARHAALSGKTLHLKRLAESAKADKLMSEMLLQTAKIEEELLEMHKTLRSDAHSRDLGMAISKRQQMVVPDLVGLPPLHIVTVHGNKDTVATLVEKFPESINVVDAMGRSALHYAVSMKGENAETIAKILTDAKIDAEIKDINGVDVAAMKASPLDMEVFMVNYNSNLERQNASEMMYRVHEAVVSGDLRAVKMALNRRELAVKPDASKLTPLHKAVILKYSAMACWIAEQFKSSMDIQGNSGLTPMHFAAAIDKDLYESLKQTGGDCYTVDTEGNDPEFYKDHSSDFILDIEALREELLVTPPSRPATAASERAKSAKSAGKPEAADSQSAATAPARAPVVMASSKKAPPPETLDAKYIAEVLGSPLTAALAEVAEKRPWDPIEYLAQWLYKHKANLNFHQQQIDAVKEAEMEEIRKKEEEEMRVRRRKEAVYLREQEQERQKKAEEDARKQREQEELQKKAKESIHLAQAPELATVAEEETTDNTVSVVSPRNVIEKDEQGRTQLHNMVTSGASAEDITGLLATSGADVLADRGCDGKTARDLAESDEIRQCLDDYVLDLLKSGDVPSVVRLMENGYSLETLNINPEEQELPAPATQLLAKVANFPKLLASISTQIKGGDLAGVKQQIDKTSLAVTRLNPHGAVSLHLAVLYERTDIVQHLVTSFPGLVDLRDYLNRTALHYANSIGSEDKREAMVQILTEANADAEAADFKGRKPEEYKELSEEITAMKEAVTAEGEQAPAEGEQAPAEGEQAPAEGEQAPAEGEQAPAADGEQAPAADGEQAPAADGEQAPAEGDQPAATEEAAPAEAAAE